MKNIYKKSILILSIFRIIFKFLSSMFSILINALSYSFFINKKHYLSKLLLKRLFSVYYNRAYLKQFILKFLKILNIVFYRLNFTTIINLSLITLVIKGIFLANILHFLHRICKI